MQREISSNIGKKTLRLKKLQGIEHGLRLELGGLFFVLFFA